VLSRWKRRNDNTACKEISAILTKFHFVTLPTTKNFC
jgi:hypothetical protein